MPNPAAVHSASVYHFDTNRQNDFTSWSTEIVQPRDRSRAIDPSVGLHGEYLLLVLELLDPSRFYELENEPARAWISLNKPKRAGQAG